MAIALNRLLIVGLGLIGGSLAKAARERGLCNEVWGVSRSPATRQKALDRQIVDRSFDELSDAVKQLQAGDIVVVCVPTLTVPDILAQLQSLLAPGVTLTDAASVKGSVVEAVKTAFNRIPAEFVPGHPIAGSERSGIDAVNSRLYENHRVILTPLPETGAEHLQQVAHLWRGVGASVTEMSVAEHDEILAATSHLPHLLAFALVDTLAVMRENREIFRYAAGGFRDFTRIAGSDPVMWRDIALANADAILRMLNDFSQDLAALGEAIKRQDGEYLMNVFGRAREARNHFAAQLEQQHNMHTSSPMLFYQTTPGGSLRGEARVPGDKSISHRAIMLGSIAEGTTEVSGFLEGEDSLATLRAFRAMGVEITDPQAGRVTIKGVGLKGLRTPPGPLYLGNSGTSMRLLSGLLAGQSFAVELQGDESLSRRPMGRVVEPLRQMGAEIQMSEGGVPPLLIKGSTQLKGIDYRLPMASAQVKSCVLLAGLYAEGTTTTTEPAPTRDHTERMLQGFGYSVQREGPTTSLQGGGRLTGCRIDVPADISSAAFFMVGASIAPGSDIILRHVGMNPTRIGVITILQMMGADIEISNEATSGGEPVADIRVRYAPLKGIEIPVDQVPLAIDEFPALFVAAACAQGVTVLRGAEELRVKESDRIQAMVDGLQTLGIQAKPLPDGIEITGGEMTGGTVDSLGDHRIAMSFAIAGLRADRPVRITDCSNVATSFPGFIALANKLGLKISETTEER